MSQSQRILDSIWDSTPVAVEGRHIKEGLNFFFCFSLRGAAEFYSDKLVLSKSSLGRLPPRATVVCVSVLDLVSPPTTFTITNKYYSLVHSIDMPQHTQPRSWGTRFDTLLSAPLSLADDPNVATQDTPSTVNEACDDSKKSADRIVQDASIFIGRYVI